jgi:predicted DNA-binding transcriptional regulator YafY
VDPLERLTNVVALLLETRVPLTFEQIADELDGQYPPGGAARRSAFERDKALLRAEGVPIRQVVMTGEAAGQTGYWIERHDFELADLDLTAEERRALQIALATVHLGESWGQEAWWKLERAEDEPTADRVPVAATLPVHAQLPTIYEAVRDRCELGFTYRDRHRCLHPYGLLARDGHWYVVGFDVEADGVRTYRLDRFDTSEVQRGEPGAFVRPVGFRAGDAFPADARQIGEADDGIERAIVLIDAGRAGVLLAQRSGGAVVERRPDGSVVMEVPCANRAAFRSWLFDFGADAEVLTPPELRDDVIEWLRMVVEGSST